MCHLTQRFCGRRKPEREWAIAGSAAETVAEVELLCVWLWLKGTGCTAQVDWEEQGERDGQWAGASATAHQSWWHREPVHAQRRGSNQRGGETTRTGTPWRCNGNTTTGTCLWVLVVDVECLCEQYTYKWVSLWTVTCQPTKLVEDATKMVHHAVWKSNWIMTVSEQFAAYSCYCSSLTHWHAIVTH